MNKKNPYPKDSRSWEIWEKNNNPEHKDYWFNKFGHQTAHRDEENVEEALKHVER